MELFAIDNKPYEGLMDRAFVGDFLTPKELSGASELGAQMCLFPEGWLYTSNIARYRVPTWWASDGVSPTFSWE